MYFSDCSNGVQASGNCIPYNDMLKYVWWEKTDKLNFCNFISTDFIFDVKSKGEINKVRFFSVSI